MSADDPTLYDDLRSEDPRYVEQAIRVLTRQVRTLALREVTGNSGTVNDVDDLVQEVVVALWRQVRAGQYTPQTNVPFRAYIFRLVRNNWLKELRKRRQQGVPGDLDNEPLGEVLLDATTADPRLDRLERAFQRLEPACQRILRLFYWEGYSIEEIAHQIDKTVDAAKQRKYRCMLTLGEWLNNK